ncbi:MAG: hypothetical protein A2231_03100 [Candidatus Firestonebacteria bacterium RIFOXYA2_FULL_40_8]|nr:MAG: hypothetical protein A2231_03100 [Candidatus Firestonebacteria bacterium RIFOXYA2_FULL_40_8]
MAEYFPHDYGARNDPKLAKLQMDMGYEGVGMYWSLVEYIYEVGGYLDEEHITSTAFALNMDCLKLGKIVKDFKLFERDGEKIFSKSILKRLKERKSISNKRKAAISNRWKNERKIKDTNVLQMKYNCNTIKVNKSKVNKRKENNTKEVNDIPQAVAQTSAPCSGGLSGVVKDEEKVAPVENSPSTSAVSAVASVSVPTGTLDVAVKEKKAPVTPQAEILERWRELYEQKTGQPCKLDKHHYVIVAGLLKKFDAGAVMMKIVLLANLCESCGAWFTKNGWADFTVEHLSRHWNSICITKTEEERKSAHFLAELERRKKEREHSNAVLDA